MQINQVLSAFIAIHRIMLWIDVFHMIQITLDHSFQELTDKLNAFTLALVPVVAESSATSDSTVLTSTFSSTENWPPDSDSLTGVPGSALTVVVDGGGGGKQIFWKSICTALLPSGELAIT